MRALQMLFIASMVTASLAWAQSPGLEGTFVSKASGQAVIDAAIDAGVAKMNFIKRPIARNRLKSTNIAYGRVTIQRSPETISVQFDANAPVVMPLDGTAVKWTRADGEVFDVEAQWHDGRLVQTFKSEDGQRVNTFTIADADTLVLDVAVSSPQLPAPVKYQLQFARGP